jgi:hypothetical protein
MWFMTDVEALGPCPGLYPMTEFACVAYLSPEKQYPFRFYGKFIYSDAEGVDPEAQRFYEGEQRPRVSVPTPEEVSSIDSHAIVMDAFSQWVGYVNALGKGRPMFISDNNGFDFQFINYYLWKYTGKNVFGHSGQNLGSLYKGAVHNCYSTFKHLRDTKHTHHPLDDCLGNVEAMHKMYLDESTKIAGLGPGDGFSSLPAGKDRG